MIGLYVKNGSEKDRLYRLDKQERYLIGRSLDSKILLSDSGVSRKHAEVFYKENEWRLKDLDSRNGTYLNALPVTEKPISPKDTLAIGSVELMVVDEDRSEKVTPAVGRETGTLMMMPAQQLLGKSKAMQQVIRTILQVAPMNTSVLIQGETGTGKELVARALHGASKRRKGPFVAINCGAIPGELINSELFGHEKGAFTGANERHQGCFEQALGGTLFLDEIGELPLSCQATLLRVLEEKAVRRVGGRESIKVDLRIVAATNANLMKKIDEGEFRLDLYHRVNTMELKLPSLRERSEDIPVLASHFLDTFSYEMGKRDVQLQDEAIQVLKKHPWPGNVRELRNVMERCLIMASGNSVLAEDLKYLSSDAAMHRQATEFLTLAEMERRHIERVIEQVGGNKTKAAEILGISRTTLYEKLNAYSI